MTHIYFVRHAQPDYRTGEDGTYGLSADGIIDRLKAAELLSDIKLDVAISSPYRRSIETIRPCADEHKLDIFTDIRLRERDKGQAGNNHELFKRRWSDFSYCEEGGECLGDCQKRNIAAVNDILKKYSDKSVLIGTHGTALSLIINYYDNSFGFDGFMRIIDYMPYVIRMDFEGKDFVGMRELGFVEKEFHGQK